MHGTMMNVPLTLDHVHRRAQHVHGHVEVVSRRDDGRVHRSTLGAIAARATQLACALRSAGLRKGDRVATLLWNRAEHLEAYLGVPLAGGVLHTLNLRLHPDDLAYIANDAGARYLLVEASLLPLFERFRARAPFERVIVVGPNGDYEEFLAGAPALPLPSLEENDAAGICYTSGTTGRPKGVVYTHRSTLLHSMVSALPDVHCLSRADTLMPVVPMFHVNAWGFPYTAALIGAKLVFPGSHLDAESLLDLMQDERVTLAAAVPTVWFSVREALRREPSRWKLAERISLIVGGSAVPERLLRDFDELGMHIVHAWGMTEASPTGLVSRLPPEAAALDEDQRYALRAKQGVPPPLVEIAIKERGELALRAPWVASSYVAQRAPERWDRDGMFLTGDVVTQDHNGFVQLVDRTADLIKSGGEWIASQQLENALMDHPAVQEAAVIGLPHEKWSERPLAVVVLKPGAQVTVEELRGALLERFAKFWVPDAFELVETIPRTSTGKFQKSALRAQYAQYTWPVPPSASISGVQD